MECRTKPAIAGHPAQGSSTASWMRRKSREQSGQHIASQEGRIGSAARRRQVGALSP